MIRRLMLCAALTASAAFPLCAQQVNITGAGSTFAAPLYNAWANEYAKLHPGTQINYQSIGSGGGIRQISSGTVDFGGTDSPMNDKLLAEAKQKLGTDILHFPVALGGVVPIHNIPGVSKDLNFTGAALAGIYLGKITKWNDPEIAKANPGVNLPGNNIVVCHRSDSSGTTFIWADFLSKASADWKNKVGAAPSLNWPVGIGGKGNEGVAGFVRQTPNSIGYVELIYAVQNKMTYGQVQNSAGKFIKADLNSVTAAAAGAVKAMPADFRVSITGAPGATAYPVSSFTWMLVPRDMKDKTKGATLKAFLIWGMTEGQKFAQPLSYAPLPKPVVEKELAAIKTLHY
ncbi:MAG: phosphate ABC transporter substrate-binding protein PstS [Acidobacteriota bacterium]|nr:phosphate ABC transporter substrate-binding protein PstS [Acidobacteriota bacterium]